jgi:hypothetical protein
MTNSNAPNVEVPILGEATPEEAPAKHLSGHGPHARKSLSPHGRRIFYRNGDTTKVANVEAG